MKLQTPAKRAKSIPPEIIEILGPPPILSTEESNAYYATLACFANDVAPNDMTAWFLVKDLADHRAEIARYRRIKVGLIARAAQKTVIHQISCLKANFDAAPGQIRTRIVEKANSDLKLKPVQGEEFEKFKADIETQIVAETSESQAKIRKDIEYWNAYRSTESDFVQEFYAWIQSHERLDVLLETAEQRFTAALHELERHVRGFGPHLRETLDKIIEGEVIEEGQPAEGASSNSGSVARIPGRTIPSDAPAAIQTRRRNDQSRSSGNRGAGGTGRVTARTSR